MKNDRKAKREGDVTIKNNNREIEDLKDLVEDQKQQILEMNNESKVRREHIANDKRTIEMLTERIEEIERPAH